MIQRQIYKKKFSSKINRKMQVVSDEKTTVGQRKKMPLAKALQQPVGQCQKISQKMVPTISN